MPVVGCVRLVALVRGVYTVVAILEDETAPHPSAVSTTNI